MRRALALTALLAATMLAGCFDPYHVRVDGDVLRRSSLGWVETMHDEVDNGLLGTKQFETDYDIPQGRNLPPAHLEVFALRSSQDPGTDALLNRSQQALRDYTQRYGLSVDPADDHTGSRTWQSGVPTRYFTEEGKATSSGLFTRNYRVRLVAEVAHDAKSSTSVVALAVAQVEVSRQCPLVGDCTPASDERSWIAIVGDASGSILGAVSQDGLLDHLETHA